MHGMRDSQTMKAIVQQGYGGPEVLDLQAVDVPVPGPTEVLVRQQATSLQPLDWHYMRGSPLFLRLVAGLRGPRDRPIPGADVSGTVEAVGDAVTDLQPGDPVLGAAPGGTLAELVAVDAARLVHRPPNVTAEEAGGVGVAAFTALQALERHGRLAAGERVIVVGASGGVGTFAVQMARALGGRVTAVCSGRNADLVRGLGAEEVVDYRTQDLAGLGPRFDLVVQIAGAQPLGEYVGLLAPGGRYVMVGSDEDGALLGPAVRAIRVVLRNRFSSHDLVTFTADESVREDLLTITGWLADGSVRTVIDRTFPLADAAAAMTHSESGRARGKVIITI